MPPVINSLLDWLLRFSEEVPLELFTIVGSFLEEVIAPIPSPLVLTTAGTLTAADGMGYVSLLWICLLATLAKTAGALLVYGVAWWGGAFLVQRLGKYFGVSMDDIDRIDEMLSKRKSKFWALFALRALPIIPSSPIAFLCGLIRFPFRTYLFATVLGTYIRSMFFLVLGYSGLEATKAILQGVDTGETIAKVVLVAAVLGCIIWFYVRRGKAMKKRIKN